MITYIILTQIASSVLIITNINDIGFKNANPYWKFVLGFNYEYNGKNNLDLITNSLNKELDKIVQEQTSL